MEAAETRESPPAPEAEEGVEAAGAAAITAEAAGPEPRGESLCTGTSEVIAWD